MAATTATSSAAIDDLTDESLLCILCTMLLEQAQIFTHHSSGHMRAPAHDRQQRPKLLLLASRARMAAFKLPIRQKLKAVGLGMTAKARVH